MAAPDGGFGFLRASACMGIICTPGFRLDPMSCISEELPGNQTSRTRGPRFRTVLPGGSWPSGSRVAWERVRNESQAPLHTC